MQEKRKHSDGFIAECKAVVSSLTSQISDLTKVRDGVDRKIQELEEKAAPYVAILQSEGIPWGLGKGRDKLSHADRAILILRREGRPMHARVIWTQMKEEGAETKSDDPVNMISAVLATDTRFTKTAPRTFRLSDEK